MDRSFDFQRSANHWHSVLHQASKPLVDTAAEDNVIDRFSLISSSVFTQLQALDSLLSPYVASSVTGTSGKEHIGGLVKMPRTQNLMHYIQAKRVLFEQTDIKDIVHDARLAGDLIKQMQASIDEQRRKSGQVVSKHLHEHRLGVIACLQHVLKSVHNAVEEYERYRLNIETNVNSTLGIMKESKRKSYRLMKEEEQMDDGNKATISNGYLSLFYAEAVKQDSKAPSETSATAMEEASAPPSPTLMPAQPPTSMPPQSRKNQQLPTYINQLNIESLEPMREDELMMMQQEHKTIVTKVHESMQMSELNTINNVQQRLSEISSMFEQFSGTLAVQLDMFESINANVMESLSNIEKTEDNLQKAEKENIPYHQLLMCYAFLSCAGFLLLVDYLKSYGGGYLI
ncbi:hypothetical protein BgAZ_103160 [Babesia gibsoni]|uniref:t-SNARE coiled-coil homology domain-containing protein n=1 Tax=Babesia gibsoni TaxID=33632 RepID=A0AAD8PFR1_BABGI|nr:hypothetical protein BgAZ_103160 [Babesia gibsoni]